MARQRDQRRFNVAYYATNRDQEIERVRRRQDATVAFLRDLRDVPCTDCGGRFKPHQMDFDHRDPSEKEFTLTKGHAALKAKAAILAEVAKCDVVCANCHRIRSRRRHREWLATRTPASTPGLDARRNRWRRHADVLDQVRSVPCADCGDIFPQCAMDFDHRDPSTKVLGVTRMVGRSGIERILAEIDKCDIVCANCHRLRTFDRRAKRTA